MKYPFIVTLVFLFSVNISFAGKVDTLLIHSDKMNKDIKTVIILPDSYKKQSEFNVVYLLHGWSDNYSTWITKVPHIKDDVDKYNFIVVMPDGDYNSWYWDSPLDNKVQYETFISNELVSYIDDHYKTVKDKKGRAITGNSMGGQGALFLAIRHQDIFGAVGSLSGGVDICSFPMNWNMQEKIGSYVDNKQLWNNYSIVNSVYKIIPDSIKIIIDCGTEDFFYNVNKNLHKTLLYRNIPHTYIEHPGVHDWQCWTESVKYQFLFFYTFFN
jgi:S-formylglutathione hydrolase FrmB